MATLPPSAPKIPHTRTIHGETVIDNWFHLRDREHPDTIPYLEAENSYTSEFMQPLAELESALYGEMKGRIQETDSSAPYKMGDFEYFVRTEEGKQYPILCRKPVGGGDAATILDCNSLAEGHGYFSLAFHHVSPDGNLLSYATDTDGSEVYTLRFLDLRTGALLPGQIEGVYYGAAWATDSATFFYTTLDETKRPHKLWRCVAGSEAAPVEVFEEPDGRFNVEIDRTRSGEFLILVISSHTTTEIRYAPASDPTADFRVLLDRKQDVEYYVEHQSGWFYMRTNDQGRNFRLLRAPAADPAPDSWVEVQAHRADTTLESIDGFLNHLVVLERFEGLRRLRIRDTRTGEEHFVAFDEPSYTISGEMNAEYGTPIFRFAYSSLATPRSVYDYDMDSRTRELRKRQPVLGGYDPANYVTERIHALSHDDARVPVSLVYRRDCKPGPKPTYLYGYGSYGIVTEPSFSSERISLLDRGIVFALAHIRGSADMGRNWYEDGKLGRKKNTFHDFVAAAEALIDGGYTTPAQLAICGGSAGGLLMGAVTNMRPDLFRAVVAHVPFVDVVNTMLDETLPLTVTEYEEWGNPNEPDAYRYIRSYAPYENVEAKAYPMILATGGLNDPRVPYWEPAKWVAKLRDLKTNEDVILLKTNMGAGHGGPSGRYEKLKEKAFEYAFVIGALQNAGPFPKVLG